MKIVSLLLGLAIAPIASHAASAKIVHLKFTQGTVSASAYTQLISALDKDVQGVSFFNTSENPLILSAGASGSEVDQMVIPQGTLPGNPYPGGPVGSYVAQPHYVPMFIQAGKRVALKAKDSGATKGELILNFIYK